MTQAKPQEFQTLNAIRDEAVKYGVAISHRSRISAAQRLLSNCQGEVRKTIDQSDPDFPAGLQTLRDAQLLERAQPVLQSASVNGAEKEIALVLAGLCGEQADCLCRERDALARVFTTAALIAAGAKEIELEGASVRATLNGIRWEVLVMQSSDQHQAASRARRLALQRTRGQLPLALVVDASHYLCAHSMLGWCSRCESFDDEEVQDYFDGLLQFTASNALQFVEPLGVESVVSFQAASTRDSKHGWTLKAMCKAGASRGGDAGRLGWKGFEYALMQGIKELV